LALRFEFINLTLRRGQVVEQPPHLVRIDTDAEAFLLVHFPPQHLAEETLLQTTATDDAPSPPSVPATSSLPPPTLVADRPPVVQSILANPSQLAFRIPDDMTAIPFTLAALLDWRRFDLIAQTGAASGPVTRIEIPYRMILTPSHFGDSGTPESENTITWTNTTAPATTQDWTELWHTRIATKLAGKYDQRGAPLVDESGPWPILPVEAREAPNEEDTCELWFTTTPLPKDRTGFVTQTEDPDIPHKILAEKFMLTSLGSWLDLDAHWDLSDEQPFVPIAQWRHIATMGRDQYVKVVRRGFLFPFGHRAVWITEVRREFREGPAPGPAAGTPVPMDPEVPPAAEDTSVAYLIRREFLVVVEQEKDYSARPDDFPQDTKGRNMPMQRVRLLTTATPPLDNRPDATDYWPQVGGKTFAFEITGQDMAGQWSTFSMPLRFLPIDFDPGEQGCGTLGEPPADHLSATGALRALPARQNEELQKMAAANALAETWVSEYQDMALAPFAPGVGSLRQAALNGQKLAIVPPIPSADSSVKAARVAFSAVVPANIAALPLGAPNFLPILDQADVNLPAVDQLAGALALPTTIGISQAYLQNGFDETKNKGQVFAEVIGGVTNLDFPQDRAGRVLATAATQQILGLSQTLGTITGEVAKVGQQIDEVQDQIAAAKKQLGAIADGDFDPKTLLGAAKALGMTLTDLLEGAGDVIGIDPQDIKNVKGDVDRLTSLVSGAENLQQRITQELETRRGKLDQAIAEGDATLQAEIQGQITALEGAAGKAQDQFNTAQKAVEDYLSDASTLIKVPLLTTRLVFDLPAVEIPDLPDDVNIPAVPDLPQVPKAIETAYIWKPKLATEKDFISGIFKYKGSAETQLRVTTKLRQELTGGPPQFRVDGEMRSFALEFFAGTVTVIFSKVTFKSEQGSKIDFDPEVSDIQFGNDLQFVTELLDILPAGLFGDGFSIDVSLDGASATLAIAIPSFGFGVFSLENLALSARLLLPFADKPVSLRFAFSERHNPFLVGVLVFAGTGFFSLQIDTTGDLVVEAALEFGAQIAFDVGVAAGRIYIFGGIYFKMEQDPDSVTLSGYVRAGGEVSVLGIASASIEFLIALTYVSSTGKAEGSASVKACISLLFFSKCVSFTVRKQFAGSSEDPSFTDMMDPAEWSEYCGAFAA
jgi:hypothetical protein